MPREFESAVPRDRHYLSLICHYVYAIRLMGLDPVQGITALKLQENTRKR